jgi:hypothetical protein
MWTRGRLTFRRWVSEEETLYCWLQRSEGIALAVLVRSLGDWSMVAIRNVGGRVAHNLGRELMQDICRYADLNGLILFINATDEQWLIDDLRFERAPEQRRRGLTTLIRKPVKPRAERSKGRKKRARSR